MIKAPLGTKDTFHFITLKSHCISKGVRRGTQPRYGFVGNIWSRSHSEVLLTGLLFLSLLLFLFVCFMWDSLTTSSTATPGPPSGSIIKKMHHLLSHGSVWPRVFSQLRFFFFFFPNDFSLCHYYKTIVCQQDLTTSNLTQKHIII